MTLVAYVSHPIGPMDRFENMVERHDNLEIAHVWFKFLVQRTRWALLAPWLAYITSMGDELYGPRALTDQITLLERCDLMVQVGGWVSPHMTIEMNHARRMGLRIVNLTKFGTKPVQEDFIAREIDKLTHGFDKLTPRRVWLPPMDEHDIEMLRTAQIALQTDPMADEARVLIARIVTAAMKR